MNINLDTILYFCGGIITLSATVGIIMKFVKKTISTVSLEVTQNVTTTLEKNLSEKIIELSNKLENLSKEMKESDEKQIKLTLKSAGARIFESYSHYSKRGSITSHAMANLEELYSAYKNLDGNGYGEIYMLELRKLPIVDPKEMT